MLSNVMDGVLMDMVSGTLTSALAELVGVVTVMIGRVTEGLIKLLTDMTLGVIVSIYGDG